MTRQRVEVENAFISFAGISSCHVCRAVGVHWYSLLNIWHAKLNRVGTVDCCVLKVILNAATKNCGML